MMIIMIKMIIILILFFKNYLCKVKPRMFSYNKIYISKTVYLTSGI